MKLDAPHESRAGRVINTKTGSRKLSGRRIGRGRASEVVVVGSQQHAEIWAPDRWDAYRTRLDDPKELAKAFGKRGITLQLGKQCAGVEQQGNSLKVSFGDGETIECDLMLVAVGRGPLVEGLGLVAAGIEFAKRKGITTDEHRRTSVPHVYAVGDCAG